LENKVDELIKINETSLSLRPPYQFKGNNLSMNLGDNLSIPVIDETQSEEYRMLMNLEKNITFFKDHNSQIESLSKELSLTSENLEPNKLCLKFSNSMDMESAVMDACEESPVVEDFLNENENKKHNNLPIFMHKTSKLPGKIGKQKENITMSDKKADNYKLETTIRTTNDTSVDREVKKVAYSGRSSLTRDTHGEKTFKSSFAIDIERISKNISHKVESIDSCGPFLTENKSLAEDSPTRKFQSKPFDSPCFCFESNDTTLKNRFSHSRNSTLANFISAQLPTSILQSKSLERKEINEIKSPHHTFSLLYPKSQNTTSRNTTFEKWKMTPRNDHPLPSTESSYYVNMKPSTQNSTAALQLRDLLEKNRITKSQISLNNPIPPPGFTKKFT